MKRFYIFSIIFIVFFPSCAKVNHLAKTEVRTYSIDNTSNTSDNDLAGLIEPYKVELDKTMNQIIGYNEAELVKGKPNSSLTNWFADALFDESSKLVAFPIDFAIQNYGGIRINSLSKGDITLGKIYELMPFDNLMYIVEMDSTSIQALCNRFVESGGWPVSHTLQIDMSYGKAENIKIKGKALKGNTIYYAAIPDYIANGGDNLTLFIGLKLNNTGALLRDLLIANIKYQTSIGKNIISNPSPRFN
jgi:2',3'-cyclic-nucleotide 2'-phosphodiesterase (5'-nucleotidase family)